LVHGEVPKDEGEMKFRIARSTSKARMAARPEGAEGGQAAWTHYEVVRRFRGATLLKLEILTGRTHQIRAHLHAFGHPVIGDPLYKRRQPDRKVESPRVLLQSVALAFNDPGTGERRSFRIELDHEFQDMISTLT
ncbi:MAG TPA: pseudouridine synthase, partial [Candidatus Methylomirabilis sp.]|nr:pseudouridine synthase [Candidatus Methylomirabilis sp.]